jgi:hypothetical protein
MRWLIPVFLILIALALGRVLHQPPAKRRRARHAPPAHALADSIAWRRHGDEATVVIKVDPRLRLDTSHRTSPAIPVLQVPVVSGDGDTTTVNIPRPRPPHPNSGNGYGDPRRHIVPVYRDLPEHGPTMELPGPWHYGDDHLPDDRR